MDQINYNKAATIQDKINRINQVIPMYKDSFYNLVAQIYQQLIVDTDRELLEEFLDKQVAKFQEEIKQLEEEFNKI